MVEMEENIMIDSLILPNDILAEMVVNLRRSCFKGDEVIAFFLLRIQEERLI
jgi:hypothetical protein